ncbi:MAG: LCP family protein [Candidatus Saganbacteria bacterium]|nr:LCP family protein [Candidatus Saganbacteria bacterium]
MTGNGTNKSFIKKLALVCLAIFLISFSAAIGFWIPFMYKFTVLEVFLNSMPTSAVINEQVNLLVLGADDTVGVKRSDTIMILRINPKEKKTELISIPRDTIVSIPGHGMDKINHAYAFGGADLSRMTVENFLGLSIPYYVCVDVKGLESVINDLGGVEVNVESRMYYVDYAGGLYVNLYPGVQRLNGQDALAYLRFRHDVGGDIGRIGRQQKFIQALAEEIMKKEGMVKSSDLLLKFMSNVRTNMRVSQVLGVAMILRESYESGHVKMQAVPGSDLMLNGVYYLQPDSVALERLRESFMVK